MNERYKPMAVLAGILFAINALGSFIAKLTTSDSAKSNVGFITIGLTVIVMAAGAYRWAVRYPMARALPELALVLVAACALSVLLGPLAAGKSPFHNGAGDFFLTIWVYLGIGIGAVFFGLLIAIALGRDSRSQALKHYVETRRSKPRRVVRR